MVEVSDEVQLKLKTVVSVHITSSVMTPGPRSSGVSHHWTSDVDTHGNADNLLLISFVTDFNYMALCAYNISARNVVRILGLLRSMLSNFAPSRV